LAVRLSLRGRVLQAAARKLVWRLKIRPARAIDPREKAVPENYIHTHTQNLLTKHEISEMAARMSPARPAGNTRKATRLILRRISKPGGATPTLQRNAAYFCLSFARLSWLGSLLWGEY
jgi:hypothetical protein